MENNTDFVKGDPIVIDKENFHEWTDSAPKKQTKRLSEIINQKESDMNTNTDNCQVQTEAGNQCSRSAKYQVDVRIDPGTHTAYKEEAIPEHYDRTSWDLTTLNVCGNHLNLLKQGKAVRSIITTNQSKEDVCGNEAIPPTLKADYDKEHSQREQLKLLEGQPFDITPLPYGGKVMIERCDHEDCAASHFEQMAEARNEICCGDENCNHFFAWTCLHHDENKIHGAICINRVQPTNYKVDGEWVPVPGRFREWHSNNIWASKHVDHLRKLGDINMQFVKKTRANNGHGFWVTWNADQNLADAFFAQHKPKAEKVEPRKVSFGSMKIVKDDTQVTITCGWGKNSHKWITTRAEAKANGGKCPDHRS